MADRALGIDISHHQDFDHTSQVVDFLKAKSAGASFVIMKASEGLVTDRAFVRHWQNSGNAGILRGTYHFLNFKHKPSNKSANQWASDQAVYYWNIVKNLRLDFPPVCDFEQTGNLQPSTIRPALKNFLESFFSLSGKRCMIYTRKSFWSVYGSSDQYWAQYPLWVALYPKQPLPANPGLFSPFTKWTFWQYTSKGDGLKYGCESGDVDLDFFNGTVADLYAYANVPITTPTTPTTPTPLPTPSPSPVQEKPNRLDELNREQGYVDNRKMEVVPLTNTSDSVKAARLNELDRIQLFISVRKAEVNALPNSINLEKTTRLAELGKLQNYIDNRVIEVGLLIELSESEKTARINELDRVQLYKTVRQAEVNAS